MFLADLSIKRPVFATVVIMAIVIIGIVAYLSLNVDLYPDVEFPYITITTVYPGAGPEQVETKVTKKIEDAVNAVAGIKHVFSYSSSDQSLVFIEFTLETDPDKAAQDVRDKVSIARGELPKDIEEPVVTKFDPTQEPLFILTLSGLPLPELSDLAENTVKKRLENVAGVGRVELKGDAQREIQVELNRFRLNAYHVSADEILGALANENSELPGGSLKKADRELNVRTMGNIKTVEGFGDIMVARRGDMPIYLRNLAAVTDGTKEQDGLTRLNGKPAVGIEIRKQSGTNTVQVADNIQKALAELRRVLPAGVEITVIRDSSVYIRNSIHEVLQDMAFGGLLAVLMVFLFLGNWRSTLISAIAIPTSIIGTFAMMKALGFTINMMTLMGLSLAVGLLIDDAIVVIENIYRHMHQGKSPLVAAREATEEIGLAVMATTFSIVAVFLPVAAMTGIVGQFFKEFGLTVAIAVLISLFIAFTLTPMLSSRFLSPESEMRGRSLLARVIAGWNGLFERFGRNYTEILRVCLQRRALTLGIAAAVFIGSLAITPLLGSTFMPNTDQGEFTVNAETDAGLTLEAKAGLARQIEEIVAAAPGVTNIYTTVEDRDIKLWVKMIPREERQWSVEETMGFLRPRVAEIPGLNVNFSAVADLAAEKPIQISIRGDDINVLSKLGDQVAEIIKSTPGTADVDSSLKSGDPDLQVQIKRDLAADVGVSVQNISSTLRVLLTGVVATVFQDGPDQVDVRVRLQPSDRQGVHDLADVYLPSSRSQDGAASMIPLTQVVDYTYATGPSKIQRYDRQKEVRISCNTVGISTGEVQQAISARIKDLEVPPGYRIQFIGETERMEESFQSIFLALALAVIFIFMVLAAQFESFLDPLAIMLSLPMAIIGAILGLLIFGSELSIMSLIGIIMLMGLVTKNAILLVDFAKQLRARGVERTQALLEAGKIRLRPILMTTFAMIFGMLPLSLGLGAGAEGRAPMAQAIIGGLVTSTILTLVVVPVVYTVLDDIRGRLFSNRRVRRSL